MDRQQGDPPRSTATRTRHSKVLCRLCLSPLSPIPPQPSPISLAIAHTEATERRRGGLGAMGGRDRTMQAAIDLLSLLRYAREPCMTRILVSYLTAFTSDSDPFSSLSSHINHCGALWWL